MAIEFTREEVIACLHVCANKECTCNECKLHSTEREYIDGMFCNDFLMAKAKEYLINETNKGEEKMEFTKSTNNEKRTKAELLDEIKKLKGEVERLERFKAYDDQASELKGMYDSYVNAGFTNEQAFEIVKMMLSKVKF